MIGLLLEYLYILHKVISNGNHYGIPKGICYSLPVRCKNFEVHVVDELELDDYSK